MENDMGELVETLRHLKVNELEKLRADLHLALTMRDKYFIQLGDARREVERLRTALESIAHQYDEWRDHAGKASLLEAAYAMASAARNALTAKSPPPKSYPE